MVPSVWPESAPPPTNKPSLKQVLSHIISNIYISLKIQDVIKLQSHKVSINVYSYIFTMHIDIFHIYSQKRTIFHF